MISLAESQNFNELFWKRPAAAAFAPICYLIDVCLSLIPYLIRVRLQQRRLHHVRKHSRLFESSEFKFVTFLIPGDFGDHWRSGKNESVGLTFRGPLFFCFGRSRCSRQQTHTKAETINASDVFLFCSSAEKSYWPQRLSTQKWKIVKREKTTLIQLKAKRQIFKKAPFTSWIKKLLFKGGRIQAMQLDGTAVLGTKRVLVWLQLLTSTN